VCPFSHDALAFSDHRYPDTHKESIGAHLFAPGVGEKGYVDIRIEVTSPGGHSSIPPPHTSIGLLALVLVHIEENPHAPHLTRTSPLYSTWLCQAEHAPHIPWTLKEALKLSVHSDASLRLAEDLLFRRGDAGLDKALLGTTQAIDLIEGGVKVNALPEQASAVVNHRISTDRCVL
jgi:Gly-Xaa carboxypeptidase